MVRCIAVLKGGEPLVLFPEGERKSGPLVQPLFDGAAFVAAKAAVPIVPVGIGGSERVMPKGSKLIYPRKVHVRGGRTHRRPGCRPGPGAPGALSEVTTTLHDELQRLFDVAQARAGAEAQARAGA